MIKIKDLQRLDSRVLQGPVGGESLPYDGRGDRVHRKPERSNHHRKDATEGAVATRGHNQTDVLIESVRRTADCRRLRQHPGHDLNEQPCIAVVDDEVTRPATLPADPSHARRACCLRAHGHQNLVDVVLDDVRPELLESAPSLPSL